LHHPELRGKFRSRRFESVVREAENLANAGAREITLIGQDTTSYGEDLGLRDGLSQLLEKLAQVDDLLWVRFLYAYPIASRRNCWIPLRRIRSLRNTWTCRCNTPAGTFLARMKRVRTAMRS